MNHVKVRVAAKTLSLRTKIPTFHLEKYLVSLKNEELILSFAVNKKTGIITLIIPKSVECFLELFDVQ